MINRLCRVIPVLAALMTAVWGTSAYAENVTVDSMDITTKDIAIVFTNDIHGGISSDYDFSGSENSLGFAGLNAVKADLLSRTENVTTIDVGDAIQGTALCKESNGQMVMDLMDMIGYDIRIPGNHEFDFGMETFLNYADECGSFLACNFYNKETGRVFEDYAVITYELDGKEYKIGYVGMTTPETVVSSSPAHFQNADGEMIYDFHAETDEVLYSTVQESIDAALADGADLIIGLGHMGDVGVEENWASYTIVQNTVGMDVFLDGHSHNQIPERWIEDKNGNPVLLASTGTKIEKIGVLKITFDENGEAPVQLTSNLVDTLTEEEKNSEAYLQAQEKVADVEQSYSYLFVPVANIKYPLYDSDPESGERMVRSEETNLGDLLTDAYRAQFDCDVAMISGGNIRAGVEEGSVSFINLLTVMPWYELVVEIEVTGQQLLDALEVGVKSSPEEDGGFFQVSGMTYTINTTIPSSVVMNNDGAFVEVTGEYRVRDVKIGGEDLIPEKTYTVAMNAFTALKGGDGMTMLKDSKVLVDSEAGLVDHDIVIKYLETCDDETLAAYQNPFGQGRITILK